MAEVLVPPGGGPPLHFTLVRMNRSISRKGHSPLKSATRQSTRLQVILCTPCGIVHCFKSTGNVDAKFLRGPTTAGLEKFFNETLYPAVDRSLAPPLITEMFVARAHAAAPKAGLKLLPPA